MECRRVRYMRVALVAVCLTVLRATASGQEFPPRLGPGVSAPPGGPPPLVVGAAPMPGGPQAPVILDAPAGPALIEPPPGPAPMPDDAGPVRGFVKRMWGYVDPDNAEIISVHQLACLIDCLDKALFDKGQVVVKAPDVWGQNRLTQHRAEYEDQMKGQLNSFEVILNGYQRRADLAALTSATSVGASVGPRISDSRNVSTTTTVTPASSTPAIPSATGLVGANGLVANANTLIGTMTPLLMPSNLTALALANKGATPGIGIEPTVLLDERSNFLNYLHQLRRNSAGDDKTDMPGYGLYLVRMPVSILPGDESVKGKGAMVTVRAKHNLTPDVLANTFRGVVILDTAYQLMDAVTRGQYLPISDQQDADCEREPYLSAFSPRRPCPPQEAARQAPREVGILLHENVGPSARPGSTAGTQGSAPASEVIAIYGEENLKKLVCAVKTDQQAWYRHDPSVVSWLLTELGSAHGYMREQARNGNPLFQPEVFENIGNLALIRDFQALKFHRDKWLQDVAKQRNEVADQLDPSKLRVRPIDVLAFALMVQSVFVDRQLKYDMAVMAQRKGCACGDPFLYCFYNLWPDEAAAHAFNAYVACKWPIHVFSLDPIIDQQNQLDLYSERTELQLALATAIATGQASFQNATTYARRLERDLAAIALNRTAVGFGAGETTFGWRFYPRLQTPPTQSNPRRVLGILVNNGPGLDYTLNNLRIEPGQRECYALMVVPNFAPAIKMTTVTNWFDLKTCHPDQELETTEMVHLGRKLQTARCAMQRLCDSGRYRPMDLDVLADRLDQLEAMLPLQSYDVLLPFEADLTGSEIFSSTNAGLGPRLLTWYGEPGKNGGTILILGSGFTVRDMKVVVGGVQVPDSASGGGASPSFDIVSRNVLRVDIPNNATAIRTPVVYNDPSVTCFKQGRGVKADGTCDDCATLKGELREADYKAKEADFKVKQAAEEKARGDLETAVKEQREAQKAKDAADQAVLKAPANPQEQAKVQTEAKVKALALTQKTQAVVAARAVLKAASNDRLTAEAAALKAKAEAGSIECQCKQRWVLDVHVATSNGISNHLFVEVLDPGPASTTPPKTVTTKVTTVTKPNAADGSTTTTTTYEVPTQGSGLPPGTFLQMGTNLPAGGTFVAPGAATIYAAPPGPASGSAPSSPAQSATPGAGGGGSTTPPAPGVSGSATSTPKNSAAPADSADTAPATSLEPITSGPPAALVPPPRPPISSVPAPDPTAAIQGALAPAARPLGPPAPGTSPSARPRSYSAASSARIPQPRPGAIVGDADSGVIRASAAGQRSAHRPFFPRTPAPNAARSTPAPKPQPAPQPAPRKSLLSRVLRGDR